MTAVFYAVAQDGGQRRSWLWLLVGLTVVIAGTMLAARPHLVKWAVLGALVGGTIYALVAQR